MNPVSEETFVTFEDEFAWTVGDPFFSASGEVYSGTGFLRSLRAQASTKIPLQGLDSGVGTGAWDSGLGGSALMDMGGMYLFADLGYWWYGDLPDLQLDNGLTYGLGLSRALFDARGSLLVSLSGASRLIETMAEWSEP